MINFKWIEFSNFLASGNTPTRIELNRDNTTLICGGNGTGKTTILDALNYVLFNKPLRAVKLGQLVNSVNKKKSLVKIGFTVSGIDYQIIRGQKPAIFEVWKGEEMVDQNASSRDLQAKLENEIIGCNFRTFNQVVVIASTGYTYFMDLDAPARRNVVEQMLDIEVVGHMATVLKDRVKEVRSKGNSLENNYSSVKRSIEQVKQLIEQAKNMGDAQVKQIDGRISEIDSLISTLNDELEKHKQSHKLEVNKKPDYDKEAEVARHRNAKSSISESQSKITELVCSATENRNKTNDYKSNIKLCEHEVKTHEKTKSFYVDNDNCDRCNQPIDEKFKDGVVSRMDVLISDCQSKINTDTDDIYKLNQSTILLGNAKEELDAVVKVQNEIIAEVNGIVSRVKQWDQSCERILQLGRGVAARISDQNNMKNKLINDKNDVLSKGNVDTQEYYDQIEDFNSKLEKLAETRAEITEESELCKLAEEMLKDKGLKAKIIKQFLPVINASINYYLEAMDANYSFVLDDQFSETIKSRFRDNFSYGSFSNGQKMRINLAILLMWRKLAESKNTVASNLLIMDEVLDGSLDVEGIDMLFDVINTMGESNIFVISHRPEIVDRFERVVEVELLGNFSHYNGLIDD